MVFVPDQLTLQLPPKLFASPVKMMWTTFGVQILFQGHFDLKIPPPHTHSLKTLQQQAWFAHTAKTVRDNKNKKYTQIDIAFYLCRLSLSLTDIPKFDQTGSDLEYVLGQVYFSAPCVCVCVVCVSNPSFFLFTSPEEHTSISSGLSWWCSRNRIF